MSLRLRLSLAFVFVVLAPLVIAGVLVAHGVPQTGRDRADERAQAAATAAAAVLAQRCAAAQLTAQSMAWEVAAASPPQAVRDTAAAYGGYAAVVAPGGTVRASAGRLPAAARAAAGSPLTLGSCRAGARGSPYVVAAAVPVRSARGTAGGTVVVALPFDRATMGQLRAAAGTDVTLVAHGRAVASTLPPAIAAGVARRAGDAVTAGALHVGGHVLAAVPTAAGRTVTVVTRSADIRGGSVLAWQLAAVVVAALALAVAISWLLARMTTRPLVELAGAAQRVAGGDLDTRIPVTSRDELGQLGVAFNEMTDDLRTYIDALRASRDELRRNLARLGDTLSGTHDLDRILAVIVETAMASVRARGGVLLMGASGRGFVDVKVSHGVEELPVGARVRVGDGLIGIVAGGGDAVRGTVGPAGHLVAPGSRAGGERVPGERSVLAVPLKRQGQVLGVLALYDRVDAPAFDPGDLETIRTFSAQATVAIDNVLLHQEAQRLSITDGLTGLWNYRYFTMNLAKEIERATRFRRPLSLLLLDLDKFKAVNDEHGHQRGDSVLIELATRISAEIREVDTFARYGGEEFVLLLPETDASGAGQAAERVCQVVRHRPFGHEGEEPLHVTVSVGVAVFPAHGTTSADLVRAADAALYLAKGAGRDGWRVADPRELAAGRGE